MADVTPILATSGLKRHFGGLRAVDGIDFTLNEGEIRAIIGPNGAGKTTFVSLLSGRMSVTEGRIRFRGAFGFGWRRGFYTARFFGAPGLRDCNLSGTFMNAVGRAFGPRRRWLVAILIAQGLVEV